MQVGDTAYFHFTVFGADGVTPLTGQAGAVSDDLFYNGAANGQTVTIAEIGVTGSYYASFVPNAVGDWKLRLTNPDGRVVSKMWHVENEDADSLATDIAAVQTDTDDIQTRLPAVLVGGRMDSDVGAMQAGVVDAAAIATDAIDADALATDGLQEIADHLETAGTNPHGTGAWDATAVVPQQDIRDAMKLAPTPGAPAAGSVDEHLDDILADTAAMDARLPSDPADESLQQASHTTTQALIAALQDLSQAEAQAACAAALAVYDPPTKAELDTAQAAIQADIAALNNIAASDVLLVKQNYAYDRTNDQLLGMVWIEALDGSIVTPTSISVAVRDIDDGLLFTMIDAGPDGSGFFKLVQATPGLATGSVFKAVATVQVPVVGPLTSGFGVFTVG